LLLRYQYTINSGNLVKNRFLLNKTNNDTTWTTAWKTNNNAVITASLKAMFKFIMNLPEYHLC